MILLTLLSFIFILAFINDSCEAFSSLASPQQKLKTNNVLILDHLNINHEEGRHDWLTAFYVDFLRCALDPRKIENYQKQKKTIWANIGANQFHLPEGKPNAQVLDGFITLVYPDLISLEERYESCKRKLDGSLFEVSSQDDGKELLQVTDPWGSKFHLISGKDRDDRGRQPGDLSEGLAMQDLTIHTPSDANLQGIGRFYEQVLGSVVVDMTETNIKIEVGPNQSLTFQTNPSTTVDSHVDLRDESFDVKDDDTPQYLSNYGPHVSMYVRDLPSAYQRAERLGLVYVNPRFKRRAYTLEEAIDDCMFRCLEIIDPESFEDGPIIKLEHEVRSVVNKDGSKYKSCPFAEIPDGCTSEIQYNSP
jgi:hypothetical protein